MNPSGQRSHLPSYSPCFLSNCSSASLTQMSSKGKGPWIHLATFPDAVVEGGAAMENHQFLVLTRYAKSGYRIYDALEDEWSQYHSFRKIDPPNNVVYSSETSSLYIHTINGWYTFNIENKEFHSYHKQPPAGPYMTCPALVEANGTVHAVAGTGNSQHFVWSEGNGCFHFRHNVGKARMVPKPTLVHIPSKRMILLIGGYAKSSRSGWTGEIFKYDMDSDKWAQVTGISLKVSGCTALVTADEKYVIIGGGYTGPSVPMYSIFILDIRDDANYKLSTSRIRSPWRGDMIMKKTGGALKNEKLVIGWIRNLFADKDFQDLQLPPVHVMLLVTRWHSTEYIHWLSPNWHSCYGRQSHYIQCCLIENQSGVQKENQ